ncbi:MULTISPECIES: aspartate--tRNA(Asn) ligase [Nitrosopumilus]|uniref:Aspartate--tRNA(Asp/Asn) ligase n=1 Tax=Nitrosopumilus piranensis TaxID=1582439 RepID=A0A0C5BWE8_9ARCH|nr:MULTISPECIES: aspartate--tRNA(Asn) ligase [Nitrosopumilus]AJM92539.1 Aspartate--tRNA ligase [Nitrosopumilus piranensis]KAF6244424.1 aspartate--tRNA(Asn) ligase [Nitrosopumilus sp. b2]
MIETELGTLRRSHYSDEINSSMDGTQVTVMGWVLTIRGHGNISFATIRDKNGDVSVVAKKGDCPDDIREKISSLKAHSSIAITGKVKSSEKSPSGYEIVPTELRVFSEVEKIPPFEPIAKTVKNIDTRLEVRPIDLRRKVLQHIFNTRSLVLKSIREYFNTQNFVEINTPKMIATATEGGAALFPIFYYNKEAFLAQSPQLYKEQLTMSFEKVFEIAPIFRAEPSRTNRHLAEAISIDLEEAFVDYNDVMIRIEEIVKISIKAVSEYAKNNPDTEFTIPSLPESIPQYSYDDLVDRMQKAGAKTEWGDDLYPSNLKKIGLEGFYFIKDWPLAPKPFYVKDSKSNPKISESFDLMFGDLELSSGSTRIEKRDELAERMKNKGMNTDAFEYHLGAFDYGVPPHAGCGIGLERLIMALTGTENIRDVTFYPRDVDRLTP